MEVLAFSYFVAQPTPYEVVKLCVRFPFFNESGWHESNVLFSLEPGPKPGGQPISHIQLKNGSFLLVPTKLASLPTRRIY